MGLAMLRRSALISALILFTALPAFAAAINLTISATILSKNQCRFQTANATLDFGTLDPGNPIPVTASSSLTFICRGSDPVATFLISRDDGLNPSGPAALQMESTTIPGSLIPYTLSFTPSTASVPRNVAQTLSLTGSLASGSYATATSGVYSDTVVFTIVP